MPDHTEADSGKHIGVVALARSPETTVGFFNRIEGASACENSAAVPGTLGRVFIIDKNTGATEVLAKAEGRWDGIVALADEPIVANDFSTGDVFRIDRVTGDKTFLFKTGVDSELAFAGVANMNLSGTTLLISSMFTDEVFRHSL